MDKYPEKKIFNAKTDFEIKITMPSKVLASKFSVPGGIWRQTL